MEEIVKEEAFSDKIFINIPEGFKGKNTHLETIMAGNKKITLVKFEGSFFACAHLCPHAGGVLSGGRIDAKANIVCPLHGYRFSIKTGRNSSGEGFHLRTFLVEERDDGIVIGMG